MSDDYTLTAQKERYEYGQARIRARNEFESRVIELAKAAACCEAWRKSFGKFTDNEEYGPLNQCDIGINGFRFGSNMPPIRFCPWCGRAVKAIAYEIKAVKAIDETIKEHQTTKKQG